MLVALVPALHPGGSLPGSRECREPLNSIRAASEHPKGLTVFTLTSLSLHRALGVRKPQSSLLLVTADFLGQRGTNDTLLKTNQQLLPGVTGLSMVCHE